MQLPVYFDYNSTTPVDPRVLDVMLPYFSQYYGNAASRTHAQGWIALEAVDQSRNNLAELINAEAQEIIFTSGSTEAINLAIKGVFATEQSKGKHIITVSTEHKAVLDTCAALQEWGAEISLLSVNREGLADPEELKKMIRPDTILVAVMLANNETGVIQPIRELADIAHASGAFFFSDITQAIGKMRVDVQELGIDIACISAHKFYGPKGVGALYVRRKNPRVSLLPLIHGGGHERGLRSGTLNVPGIAGMGKAAEIAMNEYWDDAQRISVWRTRLEQQIQDTVGDVFINGSVRDRLCNTTNLSIQGIKADRLITKMPQFAFSTGSACTSAIPEPSHVLRAMGISDELAYASVRISLGKMTVEEECKNFVKTICIHIAELRYKT
jgi:cysteine desulfurase